MGTFYDNSDHATDEGGGGAPQAAQAPATGRFYSHPSSNHARDTEPPQGAAQTLMGGEPEREPQTVEEQRAAALFDRAEPPPELAQVSAEIAELRRSRFYSAQDTYRETVADAAFSADGIAPEDARRAAAEVRELVADLGLAPAEVREMVDRAAMLAREPVDPATARAEALRQLRAKFGGDAGEALADARTLLERDPRAARAIEALGLGDDPATVIRLAEEARRQIAKGVLRRPPKDRG